jgi:hypothetical protein
MTYTLKKDHVKNWDLPQFTERSMVNIDNEDDQDIYISERSSIASSNDMNETPSLIVKRLPTPTPSPPLSLLPKQPHSVRLSYNELPENGLPITAQLHHQRKEDKTKKKNLRKPPPGQGNTVPFSETKPSELGDNHYPHWYYHNVKNPDWIARHRQANDNQVIPYDTLDPSQYTHQPALITSSIKPRQQQRKSRPNGIPIIQSNHDKQRHDHTEKTSSSLLHITSHENHDNNHQQQRSTPKQHITSKDINNDEHREHPTKQTMAQQRRKLKAESEWTDRCMQTLSGKSPQDSNGLIITSTTLTNRPKNRSKIPDKNSSLNSDGDENVKHRHSYQQNQTHSHNPPSIPSQQNHHHHQHLHVRRRPPSGAYLGSEIQVVDVSFKKSERSTYYQQVRDPFYSPVPPVQHQSPHLPPIIRDHHHKTSTTRFPTEYYGTLARQAQTKDWEETLEIPKIYKSDLQTRFYDRYLNNAVDKRLAA